MFALGAQSAGQVFADEFDTFSVLNSVPSGINKLRNSAFTGAAAPSTPPDDMQFSPGSNVALTIVGKGSTAVGSQILSYLDLRFAGTLTAQTDSFVILELPIIPASGGQTWTLSGSFQLVAGSTSNINNIYLSLLFNNSAGGYVSGSNQANGVPLAAMTRYSLTQTAGTGTVFPKPYFYLQGAAGAIDCTVRVAGFQLEQAAAPSANVVTTSSADGTWNTRYSWGPNVTINNEQEYFVDIGNEGTANSGGNNPFSLTSSVLTIKGDHAPASTSNGKPFTSGVITTRNKFFRTFGYIEGRLKIAPGQGLWPAFWLLPQDTSPGTAAELDILEAIGDVPLRLYTTVHFGSPGQQSQGSIPFPNDPTGGFNLLGLDWRADKLVWYYNRVPVFSTPTPADCKANMYLIWCLAIGGNFPGPIVETSPSQIPAAIAIDYVRWWDRLPF